MKTKTIILTIISILIVAVSPIFAQNDTAKIQTTSTDSIIYTCPMHREIISDKPGKCPKCEMELVKVENGKTQQGQQHDMGMMMMCPMHGMVGMEHKHDDKKKDNHKMMKGMGIAMGVMMVVMMIIIGSR